MLLDFGQLGQELELISGLKPLPQRSFVEDYIKAYYLPEGWLVVLIRFYARLFLGMHQSWAEQHPEYTAAEIHSLLAHASKKTKSRIFAKVFDGNNS